MSGEPSTAAQPVYAYKVTVWCESDRDAHDIAMAFEQGELYDVATNVQYRVEDAQGGG